MRSDRRRLFFKFMLHKLSKTKNKQKPVIINVTESVNTSSLIFLTPSVLLSVLSVMTYFPWPLHNCMKKYFYMYNYVCACDKSGAYVVKIRHHNCLLQVNHVKLKVMCLKIIFSLTKKWFYAIHEQHNIKNSQPISLTQDTRFATVVQWRLVFEHF